MIFLNLAAYCLSGAVSDEVSDGLEITLYSASSQAPKSINLHRCEQKGKNSAFWGCSAAETLTTLRQIGHLCFMFREALYFHMPVLNHKSKNGFPAEQFHLLCVVLPF